jgi:hypothetical protein
LKGINRAVFPKSFREGDGDDDHDDHRDEMVMVMSAGLGHRYLDAALLPREVHQYRLVDRRVPGAACFSVTI